MRLEPLPPSFVATREALHRVAAEIVAAARKPHNEIALTNTSGGFGTPPFEVDGHSIQVRVDGAELVVLEDEAERRTRLTSIADGAEFVGEELFPDGPPDDRAQLDIDPEAAVRLGELYAFGADALKRFRSGLDPAADATPAIIWPEHFDIAIEAGEEAGGRRATYGVSPGDAEHAEPYAYVAPWTAPPPGPLWNATGFTGAELAHAQLVDAPDPVAEAVEFMDLRRRALG
jgi:hypothetical protein